MVKFLLLLVTLYASTTYAMGHFSTCVTINKEMAEQDISDSTGSISQAYDCKSKRITVIAKITPRVSMEAVLNAAPSFINNYCLLLSKNYLLVNEVDRELIHVLFKGGITYVVKHRELPDQVHTKSLEDCLKYVQMIEKHLPENHYEQVKYIHKFTPKT